MPRSSSSFFSPAIELSVHLFCWPACSLSRPSRLEEEVSLRQFSSVSRAENMSSSSSSFVFKTPTQTPLFCPECDVYFIGKWSFDRHRKSAKCLARRRKIEDCRRRGVPFSEDTICPDCGERYATKYSLQRHRNSMHRNLNTPKVLACGICEEGFLEVESLKHHRQTRHMYHTDFVVERSAFKRTSILFRAFFPSYVRTLEEIYMYTIPQVWALIRTVAVEHKYYSVAFVLSLEMVKFGDFGEICESIIVPFRTDKFTVTRQNLSDGRTYTDIKIGILQIDSHLDEFLYR